MTSTKVDQASLKAKVLDQETQDLLASVRRKNTRATLAFVICWSILLAVGVAGIIKQNQIASANQKHIDCVVKLFTTPLPKDARSRSISNPSTTCNINFNR